MRTSRGYTVIELLVAFFMLLTLSVSVYFLVLIAKVMLKYINS